MATQGAEVLDLSMKAGADLSTKQYYCVKQSAADTAVLCAAATDRTLGIQQNKPQSGEPLTVRRLGISKAVVDGSGTAIAVGDHLAVNSSGKLVKNTTADRLIVAEAMEAATTDGAIISVLMKPDAVYRTPA